MDLVAGDLLPPLVVDLYDGAAPYDPTTGGTVLVKCWVNDVLVINRAPTAMALGSVTMNWQAGDTNEPGPMLVRVVHTKPGALPATFPPRGYLTVYISPASP